MYRCTDATCMQCALVTIADESCKDAKCNVEQAACNMQQETCGDATCNAHRREHAARTDTAREGTLGLDAKRQNTTRTHATCAIQHEGYAGGLGKLARHGACAEWNACDVQHSAKPTTALGCPAALGVFGCNNDATINATYNTRRATTQPTTDHPMQCFAVAGRTGVVTVHEARSSHQWGDNTAQPARASAGVGRGWRTA
jgi:hypothetical protein